MTIYSEKINEFINQLENEMCEINNDIRKLETEKQVYQKILDELRELKSVWDDTNEWDDWGKN